MISQTLKKVQVILVDNGSNPEFISAIQNVEELLLARLKIVKSNSENIFEMFNEGLVAAQGKYILFANGEDLFLENFLQTLYYIAEQTHSEIVYPSNYGVPVNEISGDNKNLEVTITSDEKNLDNNNFLYAMNDENLNRRLQCFFNDVFYPRICNKLISRKFLIDNNIKISADSSMPEWLFILKCLCLAEKIAVFSKVLHIQLLKQNFQPDSDLFKVIAGANDLKNFLSGKKFFSDNPDMFKAIWNKYFEKIFDGKELGDNKFFKL